MIVCDKPDIDGVYKHAYPLQVEGTLSDEEYQKLVSYAAFVNDREAIKNAKLDDLFRTLDKALLESSPTEHLPSRKKAFKDLIEDLEKGGLKSPRGVNQDA
jgi:hypothetical protein